MENDSYSLQNNKPYNVKSLYFDTRDIKSFWHKVDGHNFRTKYRMRYYNSDYQHFFFEIKRKKSDYIYKTRLPYDLNISNNISSFDSLLQTLTENNKTEFYIRKLQLIPTLWISYDRMAFQDKRTKDLRITFDSNIHQSSFRTESAFPYKQNSIISPCEKVIMEIKYNNELPKWIINLIQDLDINRISFSKYNYSFLKTYKGLII